MIHELVREFVCKLSLLTFVVFYIRCRVQPGRDYDKWLYLAVFYHMVEYVFEMRVEPFAPQEGFSAAVCAVHDVYDVVARFHIAAVVSVRCVNVGIFYTVTACGVIKLCHFAAACGRASVIF